MQCLQIYTFVRAIEERLEVLSRIKVKDFKANEEKFKDGLMQIHEAVQDINKCFAFSFFLSFLWLYASILNNLHWIGIFLIGVSYAHYEGNVTDCFTIRMKTINTFQMEH